MATFGVKLTCGLYLLSVTVARTVDFKNIILSLREEEIRQVYGRYSRDGL